ncbi:UNKNOWN [Stylonychia lemnae]|uniref:Transmembrane protein n=1 Tax=Stylonychia lemnae TaxID=5949 RepID=A0A078AKX3_STYLE|nr:UNKNOWN [Stylonychia lemnae]|eukprot:CDW81473.1 UNKNOWN [Stylonychia lemnae]
MYGRLPSTSSNEKKIPTFCIVLYIIIMGIALTVTTLFIIYFIRKRRREQQIQQDYIRHSRQTQSSGQGGQFDDDTQIIGNNQQDDTNYELPLIVLQSKMAQKPLNSSYQSPSSLPLNRQLIDSQTSNSSYQLHQPNPQEF